jgi:fucose 4-O-acetylase-like acetyltransferase
MQKYDILFEVPNKLSNFAAMNEITQTKKPRMEWLDALRGFTMIMVVANHVAQIGFEEQWKHSSSLQFLLLFRMPLFFFISGFLAYKASQVWDLRNLGTLVLKKMRVQLIPTLCFFLLATAILKPSFWPGLEESFHSPTKGGYWFTLVLLYMFLIYYPFAYLESKITSLFSKNKAFWISAALITLLFLVSLAFYDSCYQPRYFSWAKGYRGSMTDIHQFLLDSSLGQLMLWMPFFLFGNIAHRYWNGFQKLMDSKWFFPIIVLLAILCTMDALKWRTLRMAWAIIPQTGAMFLLLLIALMYFRNYKHYFTKMTVIGASLQYIGRRTLDIYLIHFLFVPSLPSVGLFFKSYQHNFITDTTLSVLFALLVIGFSVITSNILRISPFLKKWLFGRS